MKEQKFNFWIFFVWVTIATLLMIGVIRSQDSTISIGKYISYAGEIDPQPTSYLFSDVDQGDIARIDTADVWKMSEQEWFDFVTAIYFGGRYELWSDSLTFEFYNRKSTYSRYDLWVNLCRKFLTNYMVIK